MFEVREGLMVGRTRPWRYLAVLGGLLTLFCLRVLGQLLVALFHVHWLPPMEEWYSGIIPYPGLLLCQVGIVIAYGKVLIDIARGCGYFVKPRQRLGSVLVRVGSIYLGVMILRYLLRMWLYPQERWFGGAIPIFFHVVLACFLLVLGRYNLHDGHSNTPNGKGARRLPHYGKESVARLSQRRDGR